ncbi:creatininase family protein [Sedimenticola sp.]|uniref:creatininase family protein n=1 Tax=Sedimenticola sp. TaxID=1940285 RepID=UPI00258C0A8A|nr:creatininase family protein [Sedimenticola sp.]MCW8905197.1 creatininase family protein [Sedimenticola sp.]
MQLHDLTWPAVEAYLQRSGGVIIPIGSTEQHGPSGVIGTDAMVADAIARETGRRADLLVAPLFSIGVAEHHMAFPGTLSLRPSTLIALLLDTLHSLAHHGFRRFFFINGHGGNIATLKAAFSEIHAGQRGQGGDRALGCALVNWYEVADVVRLRKQYYADREGRHATPSEIAVIQYLRPDLIHDQPLPPPGPLRSEVQGADDFRAKYPDGRMGGWSDLANPQQGQALFEAAVRGLVRQVPAFFSS